MISVLIIVHNRAHTVGAAVRSVLAQTFADFELVVVDDGSTDQTVAVIQSFTDPRLRLVGTSDNQGIPRARNRALEEARGRYIAWLDSDDLCHPQRLAIQFDYLERRPGVAMIGSAARKIRADGTLMKAGRVPVSTHEQIRALLLFRSAFQQSSVFGRAEAMREVPYDPAFPVCEDVDMFARFTEQHRTENVPKFLIARRIHSGQTIRSNVEPIIDRQMAISGRMLMRLDVDHDRDDLRKHVTLGASLGSQISDGMLAWAEEWFERIVAANRRSRVYDEAALQNMMDLILVKAALRRLRQDPVTLGRLARILTRRPRGALALAHDAALPLLPIKGSPPAAGFRPFLKP